ncbi:MAG: SPASM domain-containing protein [Candidatus Sumerlaeota bacterium]|nr:SPASM domain-containing protein [Candidatus Sumerlaeota bacterium]
MKVVDLIGYGEPLIVSIFNRILEDCIRKKILVYTTTNGLLLTNEAVLSRLAEAKVQLALSIDGARLETFEFVQPFFPWKKMLTILQKVKDRIDGDKREKRHGGITRRFVFVAMRHNISDLPEMVRLAARYGARDIYVLPLMDEEHLEKVRGQSLFHEPELVYRVYKEVLPLSVRLGVNLTIPPSFMQIFPEHGLESPDGVWHKIAILSRRLWFLKLWAHRRMRHLIHFEWGCLLKALGRFARRVTGLGVLFRRKTRLGCPLCLYPWNDSFFRADGKVIPCCVGTPLGDLKSQSWEDIWNGSLYRNLRRTIHGWNPTSMCRYCGYIHGINGGDEIFYIKYFAHFRLENCLSTTSPFNGVKAFITWSARPTARPATGG